MLKQVSKMLQQKICWFGNVERVVLPASSLTSLLLRVCVREGLCTLKCKKVENIF